MSNIGVTMQGVSRNKFKISSDGLWSNSHFSPSTCEQYFVYCRGDYNPWVF